MITSSIPRTVAGAPAMTAATAQPGADACKIGIKNLVKQFQTKDGVFTLKLVECLGACGYAPMMQVGKIYKEHLTKEKVDSIIAEYRATVTK